MMKERLVKRKNVNNSGFKDPRRDLEREPFVFEEDRELAERFFNRSGHVRIKDAERERETAQG